MSERVHRGVFCRFHVVSRPFILPKLFYLDFLIFSFPFVRANTRCPTLISTTCSHLWARRPRHQHQEHRQRRRQLQPLQTQVISTHYLLLWVAELQLRQFEQPPSPPPLPPLYQSSKRQTISMPFSPPWVEQALSQPPRLSKQRRHPQSSERLCPRITVKAVISTHFWRLSVAQPRPHPNQHQHQHQHRHPQSFEPPSHKTRAGQVQTISIHFWLRSAPLLPLQSPLQHPPLNLPLPRATMTWTPCSPRSVAALLLLPHVRPLSLPHQVSQHPPLLPFNQQRQPKQPTTSMPFLVHLPLAHNLRLQRPSQLPPILIH